MTNLAENICQPVIPAPPRVYDIHCRGGFSVGRILIVVVVVFAVLIFSLFIAGALSQAILPLLGISVRFETTFLTLFALEVVTIAVGIVLSRGWAARTWLASHATASSAEMQELLQSELAMNSGSHNFNPRMFSKWLAFTHPGCGAFRLGTQKQAVPITPLDVPIEPLLICGQDTAFRELALESGASVKGLRRFAPRAFQGRTPWYLWVAYAMAAMAVVRDTTRNGIQYPATGIVIGFAALLVWHVYEELSGAVKGGLIVNAGIALRSSRGLSLITRERAALVFDFRQPVGQLFLSDGLRVVTLPVSPLEAEVVLRAWLSPLPPPEPELLKGLS